MNWKKTIRYFSLLLTLSFYLQPVYSETGEASDEAIQEGEQIFQVECQQCHAIGARVIGPDLKNVTERLDEEWLIPFIRNSQEVIRGGDEYAQQIFQEYNQMVMPAVDLTDDEIRSVLAYISHESQQAEPQEGAATTRDGAAAPAQPRSETDSTLMNRLVYAIIIALIAIIFLSLGILSRLLKLNDIVFFRVNVQKVNAILMPAFLIIFFALIFYELMIHQQYIIFPSQPSASAHGSAIDNMFNVTLILTGIVFIITHILLFWFAFKYRFNKSRKAYFYPDNNTLEIFWTAIPAVVLATLVIFGYQSWRDITYDAPRDKELPEVEVLAEQFQWNFRYPGEDGKLGNVHYKLFEENPIGIDFEDENALDDIVTRDLYLPVDQEVILRFRSKDVIHSVHMPHFRIQMYTTPGMPSQFRFTPTITTEEMRENLDNEDFHFELACNQICGVAHYNMRARVIIVEQDEYEKWLAEQQTYYERRQR